MQVRSHDFPDRDGGHAIPYGIYDVGANAGFVNVGTDHNTAALAVASVRRWWNMIGRDAYPGAGRLLVTCDAGGANGWRNRAWKAGMAGLAQETGLEITCCHFPPGTQCRCLCQGTIAGCSVSTLAATRRVGRRAWPGLRKEYFEAGRLRNRSACRRRLMPLSSLR